MLGSFRVMCFVLLGLGVGGTGTDFGNIMLGLSVLGFAVIYNIEARRATYTLIPSYILLAILVLGIADIWIAGFSYYTAFNLDVTSLETPLANLISGVFWMMAGIIYIIAVYRASRITGEPVAENDNGK